MIRPRLRCCVLLAAVALGCAGPGTIDLDSLPASPVAVLYREERLALDRVDALNDLDKRGRPATTLGVVRVETLDAMFGGQPEIARRLREVQGHLSLIDPISGDPSPVEGAPPAAKPLSWSPDRKKLLLAATWRDAAQLFIWDRETATAEIATSGPGNHPMGCLGPNGRLVAVQAVLKAGAYVGRLVATPPGGGGLRPVTSGPSDILPACSPTKPLVAFVTADRRTDAQASGSETQPDAGGGKLSIAVLELDREDAKPQIIGLGTDPVFTPDGEWIVYTARSTRGQRVVRIRPDGSGRTPVGGGPDDESHPAVSPDGRFVAYVVTDLTRRERLRVRRFPDGSGDRPLVTTGDASTPVW